VRVPKSWVGGRAVRVGDGRCWKGKEKRRRDRNGGEGSTIIIKKKKKSRLRMEVDRGLT
jgi:hypothetical protein